MSRRASYTDDIGRRWAVDLPDGTPDSDAKMGIPVGPPSLESLGLPEEIEVRLHNQLFERHLLTERDAKRNLPAVFGALQAALRVDTGRVVAVYAAAAKGGEDVRTRPERPAKAPPRARRTRR